MRIQLTRVRRGQGRESQSCQMERRLGHRGGNIWNGSSSLYQGKGERDGEARGEEEDDLEDEEGEEGTGRGIEMTRTGLRRGDRIGFLAKDLGKASAQAQPCTKRQLVLKGLSMDI